MKRSDLLLFLVSIFTCILGTELFLRIANLGYNNAPLNPSNISHHVNPKNFSFTSYAPSGEWDNFVIKTNKYGDRIVDSCSEEMQSGQTILLGDSFVAGFQVKDSETIAGILQSLYCDKGIKVSNLGVSSYSPLLSYAQICHRLNHKDSFLDKSKLNKIVHILYENDISNDHQYLRSFSSKRPCPIVRAESKLSLLQIVSRKSYLARFLQRFKLTLEFLIKGDRNVGSDIASSKRFTTSDICNESNDRLQTTTRFIKKINHLSESKGINYYLSAIPNDSRKSKYTNYSCFKQIAQQAGVKFIPAPLNLFEDPELYYFEKDIHLNKAGSILFGKNLFDQLYSSK